MAISLNIALNDEDKSFIRDILKVIRVL